MPPALVVIAVVFLIADLTGQKLLFASLASSAFLIYYDPKHRINTVRVMATAQILGCVVGIAAGAVLGAGYLAGGVAIILTIVLLVSFDIVHPPAVSTALSFAFVTPYERTILLFASALLMLSALVALQHLALFTLRRIEVGDE